MRLNLNRTRATPMPKYENIDCLAGRPLKKLLRKATALGRNQLFVTARGWR